MDIPLIIDCRIVKCIFFKFCSVLSIFNQTPDKCKRF